MRAIILFSICVVSISFLTNFEVKGAKILMPFPAFSKSHHIVAANLLKGLAARGHEITMISTFPQKEKIPNFREIVLEMPKELEDVKENVMKGADGGTGFFRMFQMFDGIMDLSNSTMKNSEVQKLMEEESFDIVIVFFFANLFLGGLAAHFNCPLAILSPIEPLQIVGDIVGNPAEVASVPNMMAGFPIPMTFWERVQNMFVLGLSEIGSNLFLTFYEKKYYESNFPSPKYPPFDQMIKNVSLVLVNSHFSHNIPIPRVPAMIEVGGIHIDEQLKPLPKDLQDFLDGAEKGAIYFSFGSNVKSSMLPKELLQQIMDVFRVLDMKVLFKWESDEEIPSKPSNVLPYKWLPQNEILAHKNTKLFIGHGGTGGLTEAKYHGVPVIGIPMFGNQPANMDSIVGEGWAIKIDYKDLTDATLLEAIEKMLNDKSYSENAKKLSFLMKDRPMSPLDTAAYWIEYVIRHKGAPHMRYPGIDLNFIQSNSLDVVGFLALVCYLVYKVLKCTCKCGCKLVRAAFGKKSKKTNERVKRE